MPPKTYARRPKRLLEHDDAESLISSKRRRVESLKCASSSASLPSSDPPNLWTSDPPDAAQHDVSPSSSPPPMPAPSCPPGAVPEARSGSSATGVPSSPSQRTSLPPASLGSARHVSALPSAKRTLRLGRRTDTVLPRRPLKTMSDQNALRKPATNAPPRLTQMQIDLGGDIRKTCPGCGMDYIPSNVEDAALHKTFHARNMRGIHLGTAFVAKFQGVGRVWTPRAQHRSSKSERAGLVLIVDRKSSPAERVKAQMALEVVNAELSATDIDEARLWSQVSRAQLTKADRSVEGTSSAQSPPSSSSTHANPDRFKMYLYVIDGRCAGLCLAERISDAYEVIEDRTTSSASSPGAKTSPTHSSSSVSVDEAPRPAILGVSRIWTSTAYRRQGIATRLLECAQRTFVYGLTLSKQAMAFSQPSESGKYLAERWFGASTGWKVYLES